MKFLIHVLVIFTFSVSQAAIVRTIDADRVKSANHSKTWVFPATSDTLVGRDTTDTLTNKTLSGAVNTFSNLPYSSLLLSGNIVNGDISSSASIAYSKLNLTGTLVTGDLSAGFALPRSKMATLTANRAMITDGSGLDSVSTVTATELGYLSGVTSAVQTQLTTNATNITTNAGKLANVVAPTGSKAFEVASTASGFVGPRMTTTQRNAIASPVAGLEIFNTTTSKKQIFDGTYWQDVGSGSSPSAYKSVLSNSTFDDAVAANYWTVSNGTASIDNADYIEGLQSNAFALTAVNGTVISQSVTPAVTLSGNNLEYSAWVKTTLTAVSVCALNAGSELQCATVPSTGQWQKVSIVSSAPSSGTIGLSLKTTSSSTGTVKIDDAYVGIARNVVTADNSGPITIQTFTSGTATYNTPLGVKYIKVRMVGGGGGGAGGGVSGTAGTGGTGGNTTFGTSLLTATGGSGGSGYGSGSAGGAGGTGTIGTGAIGTSISGGVGFSATGSSTNPGSIGGSNPFGGGGSGGSYLSAGGAGKANTGAGGQGGGGNGGAAGSGGGAGGYVEAIINNPAASYSVQTGVGGTAGTAGTSGVAGGTGGTGYIEVTEYYQATGQAFRPDQVQDTLGEVFYVASSTCPQGSIAADGSAISRTTYGLLFSRIGTTFGTGDGSTTFNVPNAQGIFIRGSGSQTISSIAYSGTLGSVQGDQLQGHKHTVGINHSQSALGTSNFTPAASNTTTATTETLTSAVPSTDGTNGTPRTGSETRPANISLLACISTAAQKAPLLVGSVTSSTSGQERVERIRVSPSCTSTPCTIASQSGAVSTVTRGGTGQYTVNFTAGMFTSAPMCTYRCYNGSNVFFADGGTAASTTSSQNVQCYTSSIAASDAGFDMICMGPR